MTSRQERARERAIETARARVARNTARNGADCPACHGTGVKQVRIGKLAAMPQPCPH